MVLLFVIFVFGLPCTVEDFLHNQDGNYFSFGQEFKSNIY